MESEKVPTLAKNFPDVLLALLKRMNPVERRKVLSDFKKEYPGEYERWHTSDVKSDLRMIDPQ